MGKRIGAVQIYLKMHQKMHEIGLGLACTKPYYFDVADDSMVCYVEKDFSSKGICKNLYDGVQCLHYGVLHIKVRQL